MRQFIFHHSKLFILIGFRPLEALLNHLQTKVVTDKCVFRGSFGLKVGLKAGLKAGLKVGLKGS